MLVTSVRFKKRMGGITKNLIKISKIPMISKLKSAFGGTKKIFHIRQISLIEIPFLSVQVFNVVASTEIRVILRLSLPSVTRENLRWRISIWLISKTWYFEYFSMPRWLISTKVDNKQKLALRNFLLIFKGGQILLATRQLRP